MQNYRFICTALALYITVASFAGHKRAHPDDQESSKSTKRTRTETTQHDLNKKMLTAAVNNQWEVVYALLRLGANIEATTPNGLSPLHIASKTGKVQAIEALIQHKANIETTTPDGNTPLHLTVQHGNHQATEILLKKGANTAALNNDQHSALHIAVENNDCPIVETLLKAGACADGNCRDEDIGTSSLWTPLHIAAEKGYCQAITMLLAHKARPDLASEYYESPLRVAIQSNQFEAMTALLRGGCPVILDDWEVEWDPLQCAVSNENKEAIRILLAYGADVNGNIDEEYGGALHLAAACSSSIFIRYLLQLGANINEVNMNGKTALEVAAEEQNHDTMIALLEGGASPMPLDEALRAKKTPLEIYRTSAKEAFSLSLGLSKVIKKHYISTTTQDGFTLPITTDKGDTILHILLSREAVDVGLVMKILRNDHNRILVGHKNMHGENPLHVGAKNNPLSLMNLLDELVDGKTKKERAKLLKATTPYGDTLFSLVKSRVHYQIERFRGHDWPELMSMAFEIDEDTPKLRKVFAQSLAMCDDPAYISDRYNSALSVARCEEIKNMIREDIRQKRRAQVSTYLMDEHQQPKVLANLQLQFAGTYEPSQ